MNTLSILFSA